MSSGEDRSFQDQSGLKIPRPELSKQNFYEQSLPMLRYHMLIQLLILGFSVRFQVVALSLKHLFARRLTWIARSHFFNRSQLLLFQKSKLHLSTEMLLWFLLHHSQSLQSLQ